MITQPSADLSKVAKPSATQAPVIVTNELVKTYDDLRAVDGVTFELPANQCVGFLGPNGAGKTTLMRMIFSLIAKTDGELSVFGMSPMKDRKKINKHIGVVFQDNNLDEELAVFDSLLIHGLYCGLSMRVAKQRIHELLDWMQLASKTKSQIRELSGGMVRRLMIARALLNQPKLLILDEPTTGLDPQVRHVIWALLRELKRHGMTILLTTHYMDEAQQLSDRVMIMDHGKILLAGSPNDLIKNHLERYVLQVSGIDQPPKLNGDIRHEHAGDADYFYATTEAPLQQLMETMNTPYSVLRHANLEDVFLKFTGHGLNE